jgi:hypothetical protein
MGRACGTYELENQIMHVLVEKRTGKNRVENLGVDGRIILK